MIKSLDSSQLHQLSAEAASTARRRKNYNLHATAADPIQRMLNAFEPGTYVRPHRHPDKWELFAILSGRAAALSFDDHGCVQERIEFDAAQGTRVAEIPHNTWHTIVSLAPQTVLFEVKPGPYEPTSLQDFVSWAPAEGGTGVAAMEQWFRVAAPGAAAPQPVKR